MELWDNTIVPVIEEKIKSEWKYSNKSNDNEVEVIPDEVIESQPDEVEDNA